MVHNSDRCWPDHTFIQNIPSSRDNCHSICFFSWIRDLELCLHRVWIKHFIQWSRCLQTVAAKHFHQHFASAIHTLFVKERGELINHESNLSTCQHKMMLLECVETMFTNTLGAGFLYIHWLANTRDLNTHAELWRDTSMS